VPRLLRPWEKASVISPENDEVKSLKKQLTRNSWRGIQKTCGPNFPKVLSSNPHGTTHRGRRFHETSKPVCGSELRQKIQVVRACPPNSQRRQTKREPGASGSLWAYRRETNVHN